MNRESKLFLSLWVAICSTLTLACAERNLPVSQAASPSSPTPVSSTVPAAAAAQGDNAPRIDAAALKALVARNEVLLLDVRSPDSYKAAHAKGAVSYPLDKIEKGDFKGLPKDKRIVAYCT
jgi:3-mercaptopyruvate sulfurtransferase SseA